MQKTLLHIFAFISQMVISVQIMAQDNTGDVKNPASNVTDGLISSLKEPIKDEPLKILEKISFANIFWSIVILVSTYFFLKLLALILTRIAEKSTQYRITIKGIIPVINIIGWALAVYLIIAGIFRPSVSALMAAGASIGLAIGFASQDILKNVFAGIIILFDRPFVLGDKISVHDHYGEVIGIGLRSTRIVTPDDSVVSIPNAEIMTNAVSNTNTGEPDCQVVAEIFLPINANTERVRSIAMEAAQISKYVFLNKPIVVLFENKMSDHRFYLKLSLKAYVADIRNEFKFKSDMTEIVIKKLIDEGVMKNEELKTEL